jgi:hypothetical protein
MSNFNSEQFATDLEESEIPFYRSQDDILWVGNRHPDTKPVIQHAIDLGANPEILDGDLEDEVQRRGLIAINMVTGDWLIVNGSHEIMGYVIGTYGSQSADEFFAGGKDKRLMGSFVNILEAQSTYPESKKTLAKFTKASKSLIDAGLMPDPYLFPREFSAANRDLSGQTPPDGFLEQFEDSSEAVAEY